MGKQAAEEGLSQLQLEPDTGAIHWGKNQNNGLVRDLNPGPLAPEARIIPLDQRATCAIQPTQRLINSQYDGLIRFGGYKNCANGNVRIRNARESTVMETSFINKYVTTDAQCDFRT